MQRDEKGAKRMRSASTTPRSLRGADPDEYDRVMGVTSVGPLETVWCGEGSGTEFEVDQEGVAHNSDDLSETREESFPHAENVEDDPGAGRSSSGFGRASFLECLDRLGEQLNPAILATCASGVNTAGNPSQFHPRQEEKKKPTSDLVVVLF